MDDYRVVDDPLKAARRLRFEAVQRPVFLGLGPPTYRLRHLDSDSGLVTLLIYTRDSGHHSGGWFKNPEYERCFHLSISFYHVADYLTGRVDPAPFDDARAREFVRLVLSPDWLRYVWEESAATAHGRALSVRHYRVFCDEAWHPIVPRGEVYSRELTEVGWRSWSEQHVMPISRD